MQDFFQDVVLSYAKYANKHLFWQDFWSFPN